MHTHTYVERTACVCVYTSSDSYKHPRRTHDEISLDIIIDRY